MVVDGAGNAVQGGGSGNRIDLSDRSNVTIKNANIIDFNTGFQLDSSSGNTVFGNNVTNNNVGFFLYSASDCAISGNNVTKSNAYGIWIDYSSGCTISENNLTENVYGILVDSSFDNTVFHNNFMNSVQVSTTNSVNAWDDGYPSGGNYWNDYVTVDVKNSLHQNETGSDGIGDLQYEIDPSNADRYPFMGPFSTFSAGIWNQTFCSIDVTSNSTISNFQILVTQKTVSFNVTGPESTIGFCRVTIPNAIVHDLWHHNYTVLWNKEQLPFRNWTDPTNTYVYISYTHSEHEIAIVPELPSEMVLPLLIILSALVAVLTKARTHENQVSTSHFSHFKKEDAEIILFAKDDHLLYAHNSLDDAKAGLFVSSEIVRRRDVAWFTRQLDSQTVERLRLTG